MASSDVGRPEASLSLEEGCGDGEGTSRDHGGGLGGGGLFAGRIVARELALGMGQAGNDKRVVTVKELFASNHKLEVEAGTEVVWADPHFERVWFPGGGPSVKPTDAGLATRFDTPGKYQGAFTVSGGHSPRDVYSMTIVVKGAPR